MTMFTQAFSGGISHRTLATVKRLYTQTRKFSAKAGVPQEQLVKEMNSIKMATYLCGPILLGGAYFVYKAEQAHHAEHHGPHIPPKMPYVHVMAKEFPWAHGDKCTMWDPHCKEKIEGTWPPEPEEHEEEDGDDDEEGGDDNDE